MSEGYVVKYADSLIKLVYTDGYLLLLNSRDEYITMCFGPYTERGGKTEEELVREWVALLRDKEEKKLKDILTGIFWNDVAAAVSDPTFRTIQLGNGSIQIIT